MTALVAAPAAMSAHHLASFQSARPRLFAVASGLLGSRAEAEDVVQDAWTRWHGADRDEVRDSDGFLITTTKRLALNVLDSARVRRETSVEPSLPERLEGGADPARQTEQRAEVEHALLILMERLSPTERAAYILHEAFDYPYRQIAGLYGLSEANARQLVARGRARLAGGRRRAVDATDHQRLVGAFVAAAEHGDLSALEARLAGCER